MITYSSSQLFQCKSQRYVLSYWMSYSITANHNEFHQPCQLEIIRKFYWLLNFCFVRFLQETIEHNTVLNLHR